MCVCVFAFLIAGKCYQIIFSRDLVGFEKQGFEKQEVQEGSQACTARLPHASQITQLPYLKLISFRTSSGMLKLHSKSNVKIKFTGVIRSVLRRAF